MNKLQPSRNALFNPPLRIFSPAPSETLADSVASRFQRPELQRLVKHDRVARYFTKRGFSIGSHLD
ncbi:hypothetical protein VDG1235_1945 [Verrucomicrobiia bacterium DG1235]|nr:hypothetical protein VDG1235_1945 [Verrucomicrobiae bacterium DG1235]